MTVGDGRGGKGIGRGMARDGMDGGGLVGMARGLGGMAGNWQRDGKGIGQTAGDWAGWQDGLIRYIALFPADACRPQPLLRGQLLDGLAHLRIAVPAEVVHYFAGGLGAGAV